MDERLVTTARARLTWGHAPADVERFLVGEGVAPPEAARFVAAEMSAHDRETRTRGSLQLGVGLVLIAVGAVAIVYFLPFYPFFGQATVEAAETSALPVSDSTWTVRGLLSIGPALALIGLFNLARGALRLFGGGREANLGQEQ